MYNSLELSGKYLKRFWTKIHKTSRCWVWLGKPGIHGYGRFYTGHSIELVHRISWYLHNNMYPHLMVLHKCNNKLCVNPQHLKHGDHAENMLDRDTCGHTPKGTKIGTSKLQDNIIVEIRQRLLSGQTQREIADHFGVCQQTISCINLGQVWRHV